MPEPIINPTTKDRPFKNVKVLFFSKFCKFPRRSRDNETAEGFPKAVYPPPDVEERGKRAGVKSNADDTE